MKQMRCSSCGAELKIEDNNEYAVCEHCGTKYKINEDFNINIKMDDNTKDVMKQGIENSSKMSKIILIFMGIIFVGVIVSFFTLGRNQSKKIEDSNKRDREYFEKNNFNLRFSFAAGTKTGSHVKIILDDIIESNKINDRTITLTYNDESTIDETKIIELKHSLSDWDSYEVSVNYDNNGYINEIKVVTIVE